MSGQVTDIDVTFMIVKPGEKFIRVGQIATPAFFWSKAGEGEPLTDIKVLYDDAPGPEGYESTKGSLTTSGQPVHVWYTRQADGENTSPLIGVKVVTGDQAHAGFKKILPRLNPGCTDDAEMEYLCVKTRATEAALTNKVYTVGEALDCMDTYNSWLRAEIITVDPVEKKVQVHYVGYSARWDEWVAVGSHKLAPSGSKVRATSDGRRPAFQLDRRIEMFREAHLTLQQVYAKYEAEEKLSEEDSQFLAEENKTFIHNCLNASVEDEALFAEVQAYFQLNLKLFKLAIDRHEEEPLTNNMVMLLSLIFGAYADNQASRYYEKYGTGPSEDPSMNTGKYSTRDMKVTSPASGYLIQNINYFGSLAGFDSIRKLILNPKSSLQDLVYMIHVLACGTSAINAKFGQVYVKILGLVPLLLKRIRELTDEQVKGFERNFFEACLGDLRLVISYMGRNDDTQCHIAVEKMRFEWCFRLLSTEIIAKRLHGLSGLHNTFAALSPHRVISPPGRSSNVRNQPTTHLTAEFVIEWLEERKIVHLAIGTNAHQEMIKRVVPVLKFLAQNKALTAKHIDTLWDATNSGDETMVRSVYTAFAELANDLQDEDLQVLFKRIGATNFSQMRDFDLEFIKTFTVNAVRRNTEEGNDQWYGLDLFWQIIQDPADTPADAKGNAFDNEVSADIVKQSIETLKEMFEQHQFVEQRQVYLLKALNNLREGKSVVQAIEVATMIIGITRSFTNSRDKLILELDEQHKIVDLVVKTIVDYQASRSVLAEEAAAAAVPLENKTTITVEDGQEDSSTESKNKGAHYDHEQQLSSRLEFLEFLLTWSNLLLSVESIEKLWSCFVTGQNTAEDRKKFFLWLSTAVSPKKDLQRFATFDVDSITHIFTNLMCDGSKIDYKVLGYDGYCCFETLFLHVNEIAENIGVTPATRSAPRSVRVLKFEALQGTNVLWEIVKQSAVAQVRGAASLFLTTVYIRLFWDVQDSVKQATWRSFIDTSLADILESKDADANSGATVNALDLVINFLGRLEAGDFIVPPLHQKGKEVRATWQSIGKLYNAVIEAVNPDGTYQVKYADGDFDKAAPESAIFVAKDELKQLQADALQGNQDHLMPRHVLANEDKYFDLIFALLGSSNAQVSRAAGDLLAKLPHNDTLVTTIRGLVDAEEIDWKALLPSDNSSKLLYTLQIVDDTLKLPEVDTSVNPDLPYIETAEDARVHNWEAMFIERGGLKHLYSILIDLKPKTSLVTVLDQQCVFILVALLNRFFTIASSTATSAFVDEKKLFTQLLQILLIVPTIKIKITESVGKDIIAAWKELHGKLVSGAFDLLYVRLQDTPSLVSLLYESGVLNKVVVGGLVKSQNSQVRKAFVQGIDRICCSSVFLAVDPTDDVKMTHPRVVFLPLLVDCMRKVDTKSVSTDYFDLLRTLLKQGSLENLSDTFDPASLLKDLCSKLSRLPVIETTATQVDELLCGLLGLIRELFAQMPHLKQILALTPVVRDRKNRHIIQMLWDFLFYFPGPKERTYAIPPPKCKSVKSRKLAFEALAEIAKDVPANTSVLVNLAIPKHLSRPESEDKSRTEWAFESKNEEKASSGYVGLRNLGCTCYLNSTLQQLYMIPALRSGLLQIDQGCYEADAKEDSVIHNLQQIMGFLQESEKQHFTPRQFCFSFKDYEGNPVNPSVQEDANDFVNRLVDKVNTGLKDTNHKNVFSSVMRGFFCHQMIGQGKCTHYKEREEEFYSLQLGIKNKKTLREALEASVEGELMTGSNKVNCDKCGEKVDTLRRTCLKRLPPTLTIALRRFELDYYTMQTTKINDRLEFPREINLKSYTREGLPLTQTKKKAESKDDGKSTDAPAAAEGEETDADAADAPTLEADEDKPEGYYDYVLKGVVVHAGTSNQGHYYSFIQERLPPAKAGEEQKEGRWLHFNDHLIREWDPKKIPQECFGGDAMSAGGGMNFPQNFQSVYAGYGSDTRNTANDKNAYILIYERKMLPQAPLPENITEDPTTKKLSFGAAVRSVSFSNRMKKLIRKKFRASLAPQQFEQVWQDNITYWENKYTFDVNYFEFLWSLVSNASEEKTQEALAWHNVGQPVAADSKVSEMPLSVKVTQLATRFIFNTMSHAKQKSSLYQWIGHLKKLLTDNKEGCEWFLRAIAGQDNTWNRDFLLACTDKKTRTALGEVFAIVVSTLLSLSPQNVFEGKIDDTNSPVRKYVDSLMNLLDYAPPHWKRFSSYFKLLSTTCEANENMTKYLFEQGFVGKLLDFFLGDESPYKNSTIPKNDKGKRVEIGTRFTKPDWTYFFTLLAHLIGVTKASEPSESGEEEKQLTLSEEETAMLTSRVFLNKILDEATSKKRGDAISRVISHLALENADFSKKMISNITIAVDREAFDKLRPYFRLLMGLLLQDDSLMDQRIEWILTSLITSMESQQSYWKVTDFCIEHLIRMAKRSPKAYLWLMKNADKLDWMLTWLFMYSTYPAGNQTIKLYKPNRQVNEWQNQVGFPTHVGLDPKEKQEFLDGIKEQKAYEPEEDDGADSDMDLTDRVLELNQKVDCLDGREWRVAQIVKVNRDRVHIKYDAFGNEWNEWHDMSSAKLMPVGFHTNKPKKPREAPMYDMSDMSSMITQPVLEDDDGNDPDLMDLSPA